MGRVLQSATLVPRGLTVEDVEVVDGAMTITARPPSTSAPCPSCGQVSGRLHSRYTRRLADLPSGGRRVAVRLIVRRFRCSVSSCRMRIFAERLHPEVAAIYARRTARLECIVHHLGLALGGRPAASFARRLMLPVSNDTLLRTIRRRAARPGQVPTVIGIDDWAYKRGQRYGTLVCDLEHRQVVTLLPDRDNSTVEAWLSQRPEIGVIARDRGGGYGEAARRALPQAVQVADRWHLMENASAAFLEAVRRSMAPIRVAVGSGPIDPELLTHAERIQYEGHVRREATAAAILSLAQQGMPLKQIARRTGHSRKLVRNAVRGLTGEVFRSRQNSLEAFLPRLDAEWVAGCRNGRELWRRLRASGFSGSLRVVGEWATRRRRCERAPDHTPRKVPSARALARLLTTERDHLSRMDAILVATVEAEVPAVAEARSAVLRFQAMIRDRRAPDLDAWISDARATLISSFAAGITRDRPAVAAALTQPWSNGQTEGQITRLKLVKRQMFGRGKLDLLEARMIGAPQA